MRDGKKKPIYIYKEKGAVRCDVMWEAGRLACVEDFDSDLVCARGFHLDLLDLEGLAWAPAHGGLALDHLSRSFGHDPVITRATLFDGRRVWDLAVQQLLRKAVASLHTSFFFLFLTHQAVRGNTHFLVNHFHSH